MNYNNNQQSLINNKNLNNNNTNTNNSNSNANFKQTISNNTVYNQTNKTFKVHDNEIYIIKENSIKRANEIIKKSAYVKPSSQGIKISPKREKNNKDLAMSFKETRDLWSSVYNINSVNEYFNTKMEDKFK